MGMVCLMGDVERKQRLLSILTRIVGCVENDLEIPDPKQRVSSIVGHVADFFEKDKVIQDDVLDVVRDLLGLLGPSKTYHEINKASFIRKDVDKTLYRKMVELSLNIKNNSPPKSGIRNRDLLPSVRALSVSEYNALKVKVLSDRQKGITLQEFESTFRTLFIDDPWPSFFDELMIGKMRLES